MMMRVTSISATLIVLCILAVGCGAQEPQTQGVEKPQSEKAPEAREKPQARVQKGTEPCGPEASEYTTRHLEGRRVTLGVGEDPEDPYGRLLAWVWIDGQMFNKMLVSEGLAEAVSYPPNTRYDPKLEHAEALAKKPSCADSSTSASASQTASATASPSASPSEGSGGGDSRLHNGGDDRLHNGVDDVNCSDLSGPVTGDAADEDNLDADGDGTGCE